MARPKGAKHDAVLHVRLETAEMERLRAEAEAAGLTVSEHARARLASPTDRAQAAAPSPTEGDAKRLAALTYELNKIGTNLNQIAKASHAGRPPDLSEVTADLQAALKKILQ